MNVVNVVDDGNGKRKDEAVVGIGSGGVGNEYSVDQMREMESRNRVGREV